MKFATTAMLAVALAVLFASVAPAAEGRWEQCLSGEGWKLWLDHAALYWDDDLYMPPVDVATLPYNPPTIGWDALSETCGMIVDVPGTVEEHLWGEIGGAVPDVGGDFKGVSWWSRTFHVPSNLAGKRIVLDFESTNLRAEVFVNEKLVGYDIIANVPFEVDATDAIEFGGENRLDVRITDCVGSFSWNDNILYRWGKNLIPGIHGFGGITGPVVLRATDAVHVDDIHVQNKPTPKNVEVFTTLGNDTGSVMTGTLTLTVHEYGEPGKVLWEKSRKVTVPADGAVIAQDVKASKAKLWELAGHRNFKKANLYEASVKFVSSDGGIVDNAAQRFGFRWFDVGEKNGDKQFYLNGKRVFIIAAMTRGFWPTNGIFATDEMAQRDMEMLVDLGFNMMLLHRAIGQPPVMKYSDEMGLLTYEEPGGYRIAANRADDIDAPDEQAHILRREKLRRMVIRDRSLPSMIIYNFKNEAREAPDEDDIANLRMVHDLDPARILTYNSDRNRYTEYNERVDPDPFKAHMLPFDDTIYYRGWWDQHHWFAFAGYVDENYENPEYFLRNQVDAPTAPVRADSTNRLDKSEIVFWGEEGAFGTMVRLQKIAERLETTGANGFREIEHVDWFKHYDRWIDDYGFRSAFPSVDDLTMSMGRNLHYFHGRSIENVRISNVADGYNLNGWGSASTRTDLVDMYRNPTADPATIQYYTKPLYVAIKLRDKVWNVGGEPVADIWIVNEAGLSGRHTLELELLNPAGDPVWSETHAVKVTGGEIFGELLVRDIALPALTETGYWMLNARLVDGAHTAADGFDDLYVVDYTDSPALSGKTVAVIEDDGVVADFLREARGVRAQRFTPGMNADIVIVGTHDFGENGGGETYDAIFDLVTGGARLVVLNHADLWGERLNDISHSRPETYQGGGITNLGSRGRLFVGTSSYLCGLPTAQGMSWEYQCFYHTKEGGRYGGVGGIQLHYYGTEVITALGNQGAKDILSALARVRLGTGDIFLSTLRMRANLSSDEPNSAVAKKLFLNLLEK
jgi:beta-galactosidase